MKNKFEVPKEIKIILNDMRSKKEITDVEEVKKAMGFQLLTISSVAKELNTSLKWTSTVISNGYGRGKASNELFSSVREILGLENIKDLGI